MSDCIFCHIKDSRIIHQTKHFLVIRDAYPVTDGHLLIVPKAHKEDVFDLSEAETNELPSLISEMRDHLMGEDLSISGFNIGANCGASAGQTIFHCHIHFIPRRDGDADNPRGGVRGVIPERQSYSVDPA